MKRFQSLAYAPVETRRTLRSRYRSNLDSFGLMDLHLLPRGEPLLPDELLLQLLLTVTVERDSNVEEARNRYSALSAARGEPTWKDILDEGWVRLHWGRIFASFDIDRAAKGRQKRSAVIELLAARFGVRYRIAKGAPHDDALSAVVRSIEDGSVSAGQIRCMSPDWVAARLWDRSPADQDPVQAIRLWLERWWLLRGPMIVPRTVWKESAAQAFVETSFKVLESEAGFLSWEELRARTVREWALVHPSAEMKVESVIPRIPTTLVDKALWLDLDGISDSVASRGDEPGSHDLAGFTLLEIAATEYAPPPYGVAMRILDLAAARPELLLTVLSQLIVTPVLLADIVLHPPCSALACLLIAKRQTRSDVWDRELMDRDARTRKAIAFADGSAILAHFLSCGTVAPAEVASLLVWRACGDLRGNSANA